MYETAILTIGSKLVDAYRENPNLRKAYLIFPVFGFSGIVFATLSDYTDGKSMLYNGLAITSFSILFITVVTIAAYQASKEIDEKKERIEKKEEEVRNNPERTRAAWDLAQEKLENYLDRNLSQVRSIYWLCCLVMFFGFGLVAYGAFLIYRHPDHMNPSILSSVSGILISFLGGSFIFIYKSTLSQAKEYVSMLERINAVGMSLQILDSLSDESKDIKEKAKADLSMELLKIYGK